MRTSTDDSNGGAPSPISTLRRRPGARAAILAGAAFAAAASLAPLTAEAGAWTRNQGSGMISLPTAYTEANEGFDESGDREDRLNFEMIEIAPKLEYGLLDDLTLGVQPKYRTVDVETAEGGTASNSGVAEADVYLRQNLWRDGDAAFSTQGLVKIPVEPDENDPAALGRDQVDAELSFLYGNRIRGDASTFFYNFDIGYRRRFKAPDDQVSAGAFAGWSIDRWTFVLSSDNAIGLDDPKVEFNQDQVDQVLTTGLSFTRFEAGAGITYRVTDSLHVSANASRTYAGEQVGAANSYGLTAFTAW